MRLLFLIGVVVWQAIGSNAVTPLDRVIKSVNTFSNNVVQAIAEHVHGNLVCSAVGADMVLSIATFGAGGHTEKVLRSALALNFDDSLALKGYHSLHDTLDNIEGFQLHMANEMYLAKDFEPKAKFKKAVETGFQSVPKNIDFGNPSTATKLINDWVKVQTNNHIKNIVNKNDFNKNTALVLVNAIYFKSSWELKFDKQYTKPRQFYVNGKIVKKVKTMRNYGVYRFGKLPDVKAKFLEMKYTKSKKSINDVSMFIILPNEIDGIGELVKNLKKVSVQRLLGATKRNVNVYLPKFKIESTIDLRRPLTKMGLGEIYTDNANFTGIVASPPLKISKILQKAFIEVNEKSTTATAATEMKITWLTSRQEDTHGPIDFNVDHPFVAVIATNRGLPLFSSIVMKPIY